MANFYDRLLAGAEARVGSARRRWGPVDHVCRAALRYDGTDGGRLAAASAYFGFFAVFALAAVGFVVLGQVFRNNVAVIDTVSYYLRQNLPQLNTDEILKASRQVSIIALGALVIAGVGWVETLRSSQRALWKLDQHPGNIVIRWLVDLAVLVGLGLLLMVSIAASAGLQDFVLNVVGDETKGSPLLVALRGWNTLIAGAVDLVLGAALLAGVPRLRMTMRRLLIPAAVFAVGLWVLKTLGKLYITRTEANPAYQLVAGTVGVLIFMFLLHQLLLFTAALAATSTRGPVKDLAGGKDLPDVVAMAAASAAVSVEQAAVAAERAATAAERIVASGGAPGPEPSESDLAPPPAAPGAAPSAAAPSPTPVPSPASAPAPALAPAPAVGSRAAGSSAAGSSAGSDAVGAATVPAADPASRPPDTG